VIFKNVTEMIGNTPLLSAKRYAEKMGVSADILLKLEYFNPAGSVKDRAALKMLTDAIESGKIKEGGVIIEPTSGNTGIGLAMVGAYFGMKVILTMPDTMSIERRKILSAYGAELVLTDGKLGMKGAIEEALKIKEATPNSFIPSQFENTSNPEAHYSSTAPEIWRDTEGDIDIFVSTVGTGGTFSGTGRFLKEKKPDIKLFAVEPEDSPLISRGISAPHKIQGIGANFIPENYDGTLADGVITVSYSDSLEAVKDLAKTEGIFLGISSGAALYGAIELSKRPENKGKTIVVILTDTGERYLSTGIFDD
jgi:cysteine synthase A